MKTLTNCKGSSYIILILMLLLTTSSFLGLVAYLKKDLSRHNQNLNLFLCHKAKNTYQYNLVTSIEKTNQQIRILNLMIIASIAAPPLLTMFKNAKKVLQGKQIFYLFSFEKNITKLFFKGCSFNHSLIKTPYKLKRTIEGLLKLRRNKWKSSTQMYGRKIEVTNHFLNGTFSQRSKKVFTWRRLFSLSAF